MEISNALQASVDKLIDQNSKDAKKLIQTVKKTTDEFKLFDLLPKFDEYLNCTDVNEIKNFYNEFFLSYINLCEEKSNGQPFLGISQNSNGDELIGFCIVMCDEIVNEKLIKLGGTPTVLSCDSSNSEGVTPLMFAFMKQKLHVAELMLDDIMLN